MYFDVYIKYRYMEIMKMENWMFFFWKKKYNVRFDLFKVYIRNYLVFMSIIRSMDDRG